MLNDKIEYSRASNYSKNLSPDEIYLFYSNFLNLFQTKIKKEFSLFEISLPIAKLTTKIENHSINRKLYFDELNSKNYYEIELDLLQSFMKMAQKIDKLYEVNIACLVNTCLHDRDFVHKTINQQLLFLKIDKGVSLDDEATIYQILIKNLNESFLETKTFMEELLKKKLRLTTLLPDIKAYKVLNNAKVIVPIFKGFEGSFFSTVKSNKFICLNKNFFDTLDVRNSEMFYLFSNNENNNLKLKERFDFYAYQKQANTICYFGSFFKLDKNDKKFSFYCMLNLLDIVFFFLQTISIYEIMEVEMANETKDIFSDFKFNAQ